MRQNAICGANNDWARWRDLGVALPAKPAWRSNTIHVGIVYDQGRPTEGRRNRPTVGRPRTLAMKALTMAQPTNVTLNHPEISPGSTMPIELIHAALGLTFLAIWAIAGAILVSEK